jgi:hypothetical protein
MSVAVVNRNSIFAARAPFLGTAFSDHVDIVVITQENLYDTRKRPTKRKNRIFFQSIDGSEAIPNSLDNHFVSIVLLELDNMCSKINHFIFLSLEADNYIITQTKQQHARKQNEAKHWKTPTYRSVGYGYVTVT